MFNSGARQRLLKRQLTVKTKTVLLILQLKFFFIIHTYSLNSSISDSIDIFTSLLVIYDGNSVGLKTLSINEQQISRPITWLQVLLPRLDCTVIFSNLPHALQTWTDKENLITKRLIWMKDDRKRKKWMMKFMWWFGGRGERKGLA